MLKKQSSREIGKTVSKSEVWSLNTRKSFKNDLCSSCRGLALWPLSRFLAVPHRPPFPLIPWERLCLPLLWKSQRADSPLRDTQLWSAPAHRWVTCCEARRVPQPLPSSQASACKTLYLPKPWTRRYLVLCKAISAIGPHGHGTRIRTCSHCLLMFKGAVHSQSMNPGSETTVDILVKILMVEFRCLFFLIEEINLPRGLIGIWVGSQ